MSIFVTYMYQRCFEDKSFPYLAKTVLHKCMLIHTNMHLEFSTVPQWLPVTANLSWQYTVRFLIFHVPKVTRKSTCLSWTLKSFWKKWEFNEIRGEKYDKAKVFCFRSRSSLGIGEFWWRRGVIEKVGMTIHTVFSGYTTELWSH